MDCFVSRQNKVTFQTSAHIVRRRKRTRAVETGIWFQRQMSCSISQEADCDHSSSNRGSSRKRNRDRNRNKARKRRKGSGRYDSRSGHHTTTMRSSINSTWRIIQMRHSSRNQFRSRVKMAAIHEKTTSAKKIIIADYSIRWSQSHINSHKSRLSTQLRTRRIEPQKTWQVPHKRPISEYE